MPQDTNFDVADVTPQEAWKSLVSDAGSVLVDVRTKSEWSYVGGPDLDELGKQAILLEWLAFPDMAVNQTFDDDLFSLLGDRVPTKIYFLCRSGVRSLAAAKSVTKAAAKRGDATVCFNVSEGFEGDLNNVKQRGKINGWKKHNLPWRQT